MNAKTQAGWGLVETLLTLGALSVLSTAIYSALGPASATAQTKREQDNLRDLSLAVENSFGLTGHFSGVSASSVVRDGLAPGRMMDGTRLRTAWGTGVDLAPVSIRAPNDGFVVVYPLAPTSVCAKLAAAVARDVYDLRIDGSSVMDSGRLDVNATAALCGGSDAATMEFVYHSGLVAGGHVAAAPLLSLPPSPPVVAPPAGVPVDISVGPVASTGPATPGTPVAPTVTPPGAPPPAVTPPVSGPSTTPTAPPAGPPVGPPPALALCVVPPTETQTLACPPGQVGTQEQQRAGYCSTSPGGAYEAWETPRMTGWTLTSNTCTACPAPATETQTLACPVGQTGSIVQSRTVSYNCPAGTTVLPPPTYSGWTTTSNTCAASGAWVRTLVFVDFANRGVPGFIRQVPPVLSPLPAACFAEPTTGTFMYSAPTCACGPGNKLMKGGDYGATYHEITWTCQ